MKSVFPKYLTNNVYKLKSFFLNNTDEDFSNRLARGRKKFRRLSKTKKKKKKQLLQLLQFPHAFFALFFFGQKIHLSTSWFSSFAKKTRGKRERKEETKKGNRKKKCSKFHSEYKLIKTLVSPFWQFSSERRRISFSSQRENAGR